MVDQILQRLIRIVKFDQTVYKEIEHDENANSEAIIVVIASAVLAFIGSLIAALMNNGAGVGAAFANLLIAPLVGWLFWSWLTMFVGTRLFEGEATFWEMARTLGYATAPQALGLLAFIPCLNVIAGLAGLVLSLIIGFFAVREALDLPTEKAILTIVISWVVVVVVNLVITVVFGGGMALLGSLG